MPGMEYVFQVRAVFEDLEGQYGPISDSISTLESRTAEILKMSECIKKTNPPRYRLPIKENKNARNNKARTKKMTLGMPPITFVMLPLFKFICSFSRGDVVFVNLRTLCPPNVILL